MDVMEATESPAVVDCVPVVSRPGISAEMLARAEVRRVSAAEAQTLCGLAEPGLFLPYRSANGEPVLDGGKPYGRLRLDKPQDGKKYHQAVGSNVHAYVTPSAEPCRRACDRRSS